MAQTKAGSHEALECFKCGTAKGSGDVNLAACLMRLIIRRLFQGEMRRIQNGDKMLPNCCLEKRDFPDLLSGEKRLPMSVSAATQPFR